MRDVVVVLCAFDDAPKLFIDELLGILQLRAHIGDQRVARAVFAGQIGVVLGDIGILCTQLADHVRGDSSIQPARIGTGFGELLHLVIFCACFGGLHAGGDQLVIEIGDLLVVDSDALGHRQIVDGTIIGDGFLGDHHAILEVIDLAAEPFGGDLVGVGFGANLLIEIGGRDGIGYGRCLARRFRTHGDIDQECRALACHLHALLQHIHGIGAGDFFRAETTGSTRAPEQALDGIEQAGFRDELVVLC